MYLLRHSHMSAVVRCRLALLDLSILIKKSQAYTSNLIRDLPISPRKTSISTLNLLSSHVAKISEVVTEKVSTLNSKQVRLGRNYDHHSVTRLDKFRQIYKFSEIKQRLAIIAWNLRNLAILETMSMIRSRTSSSLNIA